MDPEEQLLTIYRQFPCRTLPNAFWKTALSLEGDRLSIRWDSEDSLIALALWQDSRLLTYWCDELANNIITPQQIAQTDFALVHADCLSVFSQRKFLQRQSYFRMIHRGKSQEGECPPGFIYENVNPETETVTVAALLQLCYCNININQKIVRTWIDYPVYDPDLWVWVVDRKKNQKVGLGIAEIDHNIPEASLEWIQVLPSYQRRGLGKAIVAELLHRINGKAAFTTVSGKIGTSSHVLHFYRRCGFTGSDVWWLLTS